MKFERFEDVPVWKDGVGLAVEVFRMTEDRRFRYKGDIANQLQRAALSVSNNIAEGFERGTQAEFLNYLYIAKGSAGEVRAQLYVGLDVGYFNIETFTYLNGLVLDCSRLIHSFTEKLKGSNVRGQQFRPGTDLDEAWLQEEIKNKAPEVYERFYGKAS